MELLTSLLPLVLNQTSQSTLPSWDSPWQESSSDWVQNFQMDAQVVMDFVEWPDSV